MSEADKVNVKVIVTAVVVVVVALIAMVIAVYELFGFTITAEIHRKVNAVESTQLRNLRAEETTRLTHYQWVDQPKGVVRVPVERAVELILSEGYKRPPLPPEAPAAPAAPAPAAPAAAPAVPAAPAPGAGH